MNPKNPVAVSSNASPGGYVIWITGLSGAGKSTVSKSLISKLKTMKLSPILLDGDEIRESFQLLVPSDSSFTRDYRVNLAITYARFARLLAAQGFFVVVATISLFEEVHAWNRANISKYFEFYLDVPLSELVKRDPKGIYARFELGLTKNVSGLDVKVDIPKNPDLWIKYEDGYSVEEQVAKIIEALGDNEAFA